MEQEKKLGIKKDDPPTQEILDSMNLLENFELVRMMQDVHLFKAEKAKKKGKNDESSIPKKID